MPCSARSAATVAAPRPSGPRVAVDDPPPAPSPSHTAACSPRCENAPRRTTARPAPGAARAGSGRPGVSTIATRRPTGPDTNARAGPARRGLGDGWGRVTASRAGYGEDPVLVLIARGEPGVRQGHGPDRAPRRPARAVGRGRAVPIDQLGDAARAAGADGSPRRRRRRRLDRPRGDRRRARGVPLAVVPPAPRTTSPARSTSPPTGTRRWTWPPTRTRRTTPTELLIAGDDRS